MNQQQNSNYQRQGNGMFPSILIIALAVLGGWYYYQSQQRADQLTKQGLETIQAAQNQVNAAMQQANSAIQDATSQANSIMNQANKMMHETAGIDANNPNAKARIDLGKVILTPGSVEANISSYLNDKNAKIDSNKRFVLNQVSFPEKGATLNAQSQSQIALISEIIKSSPTAKVLISGFTDNKGIPGANNTLSQARADSVRAAMLSQGISADRIEAKGFGDKNPIADNATAEGRALNQRIELSFLAK